MKIIFNGAIFSTGRKDGIPRYTTEILKAMDKYVGNYDVELLTPVDIDFSLNNIKVVKYKEKLYHAGRIGGEIWRQYSIFRYAKKDSVIVDLGMMLPFLRNDICAVYDCQPEKYPGNYNHGLVSRVGAFVRRKQRKNAIIKSKLIITDSFDAANDIVNFYGVPREKLKVVYCAWQHFKDVEVDEKIFNKYPSLQTKDYFFSLGSRFRHKNIDWVLEAAKQNSDYLFVITGYNDVASYSGDIVNSSPENVIFTGYLSDGEIKALMSHCKAFIHPSFNEGFGMPPLEALSTGAELIVSNTSCLPEVYEDCAHYIDPYKYDNIDLDLILSEEIDNSKRLLEKYSWDKSAKLLFDILKDYIHAE